MHSADRVLHELRKACEAVGSQIAWANEHKVSAAYLSDVLNKRRDPGGSLLDALGYERVTLYRKRK